jgi:hypothetical protein
MAATDVLNSNMLLRSELARARAVARATRKILASSRYADDHTFASVSTNACEEARRALDACDDAGDPQ